MYRLLFILLLGWTLPVMAQSDLPDDLIPLPELEEFPELPDVEILDNPPPLPPELELDPDLETQVTITKRGDDTIEEHRINGEIYMIKVIPRIGFPYYLVKNNRGGIATHPGDPGSNISVPMWRILEF